MRKTIHDTIIELSNGDQFTNNSCFYLYDLFDIKRKIKLLDERPKNVSLYYAMKANSNNAILEFMRMFPSVNGIEIASKGEFNKISQIYYPDQIIFTGPGKTVQELELAIEKEIRLINLESIVEAKRINTIAQTKGLGTIDVLVRINTDYHIDGAIENMAGCSTHLGIDQRIILDALKKINTFSNLNVKGYHVFSASGVMDYHKLLDYAKYVFELNKILETETKIKTQVLDFGGGFGIDYSGNYHQFNTKLFFEGLNELINEYKCQNVEIILELGRYLVGEAGYYVSEIIDIKDTRGKKHIIAAGGTNHLRLPLATGINQPTHVIKRNKPIIIPGQTRVRQELVNVCGPLCYAEDRLALDTYIDQADIGDLVVISQAGAYGPDVSSEKFLSHEPAREYVIECSDENNDK